MLVIDIWCVPGIGRLGAKTQDVERRSAAGSAEKGKKVRKAKEKTGQYPWSLRIEFTL